MTRRAKRLLVHALLIAGCGGEGFQGLDQSPTDSLAGRILLDGRPVVGAQVHVVEDGVSVAKVLTDSAGRFRFIPLPRIGPTTLVAHDERGQAALEQIHVYVGGENDLGSIHLGSINRFPMLLTFRGLGLDERVTDASGDLAVLSIEAGGNLAGQSPNDRIMFTVTSRAHPTPQEILALSLADGEVTTIFDSVPTGLVWFTDEVYLQQLPTLTGLFHEVALVERASGLELARFEPAQGYTPDFEDAASTLWFEVANQGPRGELELSVLVLSSDGRVARSAPLGHEAARVVGADEQAIYYLALAALGSGDRTDGFRFRPARIHRLDRASLVSQPVGPILNPEYGSVPFAEYDPEARSLYLVRGVGPPGVCALSELSVETQELRDLFVLDVGIESCQDMAIARYDRAFLLWGRPLDDVSSSFFLAELDRESSLHRLASGPPRVCFDGGVVLGFCWTAQPAVFSFETSTWTVFDRVVRVEGLEVDVCREGCQLDVLEDGTVVLRSRLSPGGSAVGVMLELLPGGERRVRTFAAPPDPEASASPGYPVRIHASIEVASHRRDENGRRQLFVAPRGTSLNAFSPATLFSLEGIDDLGISADERWLFYLARDPVSGQRQLFRTAADRRNP